jgi:hypothetical protein
VNFAEKVVGDLSAAVTSGAYAVDFIPARMCPSSLTSFVFDSKPVDYLPSWLPGGGFKNTAATMRADRERLMAEPIEFVRTKLVGHSLRA